MHASAWAAHRHWTVADGLPSGEVQQIVELPNRQMLVNCEGVFCLSNGAGFDVIACDYSCTYQMATYAKGYGRLWQGDSLLWLHDFYRVFLFDARIRAFRRDIEPRLTAPDLRRFAQGELLRAVPDERQWRQIDSLGLARNYSTMAQDSQGGLWIGTRNDGIVYLSPHKPNVEELRSDHPLIGIARSFVDREGRIWRCRADGVACEEQGTFTLYNVNNVKGLPYNRTTFVQQLPDGRYLLCDSLSTLGYFMPQTRTFVSLNAKLPALKAFRHIVGACPLSGEWVLVYAQNGIFMLDTKADTLAAFAPASVIGQYATKYNCVLSDRDGRLWIGTQNGLFSVDGLQTMARRPDRDVYRDTNLDTNLDENRLTVQRVEGLRNNCIRSLLLDAKGHVWAGTSCGVSRITPDVVNLGPEDGIPACDMMERAACLTADSQLVFALGASHAFRFSPDSVTGQDSLLPVVITAFRVNDCETGTIDLPLAHYQNYLTFRFSALNYATPSHTRYRYRLTPLEAEWNFSNTGSGQAEAHYVALPPGDYRFEVQASTSADQWGEPTIVAFEIRPPLWLTWWAKAGYVLLGLLAVSLLIHLYLKKRKQQLERRNEERVNRLFELRDAARHQFALSVSIVPNKISANHQEEILVEKLLKAIGQNMDNMDYTVDQMASDIAMSRASLYKKTQQMLGITPNEFLRNVRLKHAARLLAETDQPVNQISLMVGFQTPRYFSQCFRQMFGVTPTEYRSGDHVSPSSKDLSS